MAEERAVETTEDGDGELWKEEVCEVLPLATEVRQELAATGESG
jgi:hypothetical protein